MAKFLKGRIQSNAKGSKEGDSKNDSSFLKRFSFLKWLDPFTYVDLFVMPQVRRVSKSFYVEVAVNVFFAIVFAWIVYTVLGVVFGTSSPLVIVYSGSMENVFFRGDVMLLSKINSSAYAGAFVDLNRAIEGVPVFEYLEPKYYSLSESPNPNNLRLESFYFKDLNKYVEPNKEGFVVVYNSYPNNLPIIHRAILKINANDGVFFLTKGDNDLTNPSFDADCGRVVDLGYGRIYSEKPCITLYAIPEKEIVGMTFGIIPKIGCVKLWIFDDIPHLIMRGNLPNDFKGIC